MMVENKLFQSLSSVLYLYLKKMLKKKENGKGKSCNIVSISQKPLSVPLCQH